MNMCYLLLADDPPQPPPGGFLGNPMNMFLIIGLMLLFWVVVIAPMSRRQRREQEQQIATLKRGTKVLTNAGIVATVVSAKDGEDEIVIRTEDSKLRIKRNVVVQILGSEEAEAAKQS
jgi:preprotein translocase YajC subunit